VSVCLRESGALRGLMAQLRPPPVPTHAPHPEWRSLFFRECGRSGLGHGAARPLDEPRRTCRPRHGVESCRRDLGRAWRNSDTAGGESCIFYLPPAFALSSCANKRIAFPSPQELRLRVLVLEVLREAVMWSPANGHELAAERGLRNVTSLVRWLTRAVVASAPGLHDAADAAAAAAAVDAVDPGDTSCESD
jgi:hypothetical protein